MQTNEGDILLRLCGGNADAAALITGFWDFCEVYDDAIDGDKNQADAEIHAAMHWALFGLQSNNFYQRHRAALQSAMQVAIAEWKAANAMERTRDREQLITAYTLRCSPYSFFVAVVLAAAGPLAAAEAAAYFRTRPSPDRLDDYLREHNVGD
jgi:hypothetical protein